MLRAVYGENAVIEALPATPLDQHVHVDVKLSGCPIDSTQFLSVTASLLKDYFPYITHKPVCLECKLRENPCVLLENNLPCLVRLRLRDAGPFARAWVQLATVAGDPVKHRRWWQ